jgi:hypothetical protein
VVIGTAEFVKMALVGLGLAGGSTVALEKADKLRKIEKQMKDLPPIVPLGITQKCPIECPAKNGALAQVDVSASEFSIKYQAWVTKFPVGVEWVYRGVYFDGFYEVMCTLEEAKAKYEQFLDKNDPTKWAKWFQGGDTLIKQARSQADAAQPSPPVFLMWFFHELPVMTLLDTIFRNDSQLRIIVCKHEPMPELTKGP